MLGLIVSLSPPVSYGAAGQLAESRWSPCPHHSGATAPLWGNRAGAHLSGIKGSTEKYTQASIINNKITHTHTCTNVMISALNPWCEMVGKLVGVGADEQALGLCECAWERRKTRLSTYNCVMQYFPKCNIILPLHYLQCVCVCMFVCEYTQIWNGRDRLAPVWVVIIITDKCPETKDTQTGMTEVYDIFQANLWQCGTQQ